MTEWFEFHIIRDPNTESHELFVLRMVRKAKSMTNPEALEQARTIFRMGKLVRDRVVRAHSVRTAGEGDEALHRVLSVDQLHVVLAAREHGEVTVSQLAELSGVSPPSASAMVDRLVEKGFLEREQSKEDRRKVIIRLSPEAKERVEKAEESILQVFVDLVEEIGPETARQWVEVLERVRDVMDRGDGEKQNSLTSGE